MADATSAARRGSSGATGGGTVLVVGTGLIGTSIALALREQREVLLSDSDPGRLSDAVQRGAGRPWDPGMGGGGPVDLAVVCTPPRATAAVIRDLVSLDIAKTITHVAGAQTYVQADLQTLMSRSSRICGGHPLAGRERSGPGAAVADLFVGRPWAVCPSSFTAPEAVAEVVALARDCGAEPLVLSAEEHDAAVAASSHLVQITASALAARLLEAPPHAVAVSGPGLADTTRIAASDPALWAEVLTANAAFVAPLADAVSRDLAAVAQALQLLAAAPDDAAAVDLVRDLLERGNRGRALVPVKRGGGDFRTVAVTLADAPGQLAEAFAVAARTGVNVEDVRVEHLPGRPTGVVRLLVGAAVSDLLVVALTEAGLRASVDVD